MALSFGNFFSIRLCPVPYSTSRQLYATSTITEPWRTLHRSQCYKTILVRNCEALPTGWVFSPISHKMTKFSTEHDRIREFHIAPKIIIGYTNVYQVQTKKQIWLHLISFELSGSEPLTVEWNPAEKHLTLICAEFIPTMSIIYCDQLGLCGIHTINNLLFLFHFSS